jgi:hypothetical protein
LPAPPSTVGETTVRRGDAGHAARCLEALDGRELALERSEVSLAAHIRTDGEPLVDQRLCLCDVPQVVCESLQALYRFLQIGDSDDDIE